ncbi:GNAT family N-acetyltransferase [Paludibacterium yongneupense]|uniref:GNAT family N-acetyltransferase n=1 Tax=Paludibacterium yongneupense TaxID=400061 RepID=UPI00040D77D7|nr:GNAT family N-acetyltransferase [Paludibacterium yongneupense]
MLIVDGFDQSVEQVYDLIRAVYRESDMPAFFPDGGFPEPTAFGAWLAALKRRSGSIMLVVKHDSALVGYLILDPSADDGDRCADLKLGLLSAYQRQGAGARLLEHAFSLAREEGWVDTVYLAIRHDNEGALRLFEQTGMLREADRDRDALRSVESADEMRLALDLAKYVPVSDFAGGLQMGDRARLQPRSI